MYGQKSFITLGPGRVAGSVQQSLGFGRRTFDILNADETAVYLIKGPSSCKICCKSFCRCCIKHLCFSDDVEFGIFKVYVDTSS